MDVKGPYREGNQATVGSNSRTKLLVQANDQQLGDWQGWKKVVKPRSKVERIELLKCNSKAPTVKECSLFP